MKKIYIENKSKKELQELINNSSTKIQSALSIQVSNNEAYIMQDTNKLPSKLAIEICEDGSSNFFEIEK